MPATVNKISIWLNTYLTHVKIEVSQLFDGKINFKAVNNFIDLFNLTQQQRNQQYTTYK